MAWYDQLITDIQNGFASIATDVKSILPRVIPPGGSAGQALVKSTSADYAAGWVTLAGTGVSFASVANYPAMIALGTPTGLLVVKVDYDVNKSMPNAIYTLWPDGIRSWISSLSDVPPTDFSSVGSVIDDGGGTFQGSASVNSSKVFDGDTATYYDAANGDANKYVGRDLLTARTLNRVVLIPRQSAQYGSQINGGQLQYSDNRVSWTTLYTVSGVTNANYTQKITVNFAPVSARYWRMYWPNSNSFGNISEMQLLYTN